MTAHTLLEKWRLLQAILAHPDLTSNAKMIGAKLLDHLNSKTGCCFPSYQTLGKGTGMSRRSAINAVKVLETNGVVVVHRRSSGPSRRGLSNEFDFAWSWAEQSRQVRRSGQNPAVHGAQSNTAPSATSRSDAGAVKHLLDSAICSTQILEDKPLEDKPTGEVPDVSTNDSTPIGGKGEKIVGIENLSEAQFRNDLYVFATNKLNGKPLFSMYYDAREDMDSLGLTEPVAKWREGLLTKQDIVDALSAIVEHRKQWVDKIMCRSGH
jgi:hypothetical protein